MGDLDLSAEIKALAQQLGFPRVGIARAEPLEGQRLRAFIDEGRHGSMGWLADTRDVRLDPTSEGMVLGAQSVLVVALPYAREREAIGPSEGVVSIARYARGRDYHRVMRKGLRKLETFLRERGFEARHSVDSRPVLEREWAERAGLGFIGKNCCLIVPGLGSHCFLGTVVTTAALAPDEPIKRRCGDCDLCLRACPTQAFLAPGELDARRCISYLTIERDGPIEPALRDKIAPWIYGCDACQDVCPYNRGALPPEESTRPFAATPRWAISVQALASMDLETFDRWSEGSPIRRAGLFKLQRNLAYAMAHAETPEGEEALAILQRSEDAMVRDAADWALEWGAQERKKERG